MNYIINFFKGFFKTKKSFISTNEQTQILIKEEPGKVFFERDMKTGELVKKIGEGTSFKRIN